MTYHIGYISPQDGAWKHSGYDNSTYATREDAEAEMQQMILTWGLHAHAYEVRSSDEFNDPPKSQLKANPVKKTAQDYNNYSGMLGSYGTTGVQGNVIVDSTQSAPVLYRYMCRCGRVWDQDFDASNCDVCSKPVPKEAKPVPTKEVVVGRKFR
jgi:hypothetical protein